METTQHGRPSKRRYRIRPLRLTAVALLLCLVAGAVLVLPRSLGFLLRVPAPSPLASSGSAGFTEVASTPYSGRCLSLGVAADGTSLAAALEADGLTVYALYADGSHLKASCALTGEIGPAVFLPSGYLIVWSTERSGGGGGTVHGFGPLTKTYLARSPIAPAWSCRLDHSGAALLPLPTGVAAIYATGDGVPAGCVLISDTGKKGPELDLADGIYTAWDVAAVSGLIALGGAVYTGQTPAITSFANTYTRDGTGAMNADADSPPIKLAASATGSHLVFATRDRLAMVNNGGNTLWSRRVPGDAVRGLHVFPDGRTFLAGPDAGLSLDDRGRVLGRWSLTGSGQVSRPGPTGHAILSLPGGAVIIDSTGKVIARALWEGSSQLIASDATAQWLCRADGAGLTLYRRG